MAGSLLAAPLVALVGLEGAMIVLAGVVAAYALLTVCAVVTPDLGQDRDSLVTASELTAA